MNLFDLPRKVAVSVLASVQTFFIGSSITTGELRAYLMTAEEKSKELAEQVKRLFKDHL